LSRIIATGGLAFIRSNHVTNYIEHGKQVVILVNSSIGELRFVQDIDSAALSVCTCDIATDLGIGLAKALRQCDAVYHLAQAAKKAGVTN